MRIKFGFLPVFLIVLSIGLCLRFADFSMAVAMEKPKAEETKKADKKEEKKDAKAAEEPLGNPDYKAPTTAEVAGEEPPSEDDLNDSEIDVLRQLADRRRTLDAREKALSQREAILKATQGELAQKYKELDTLRGEIKKLLDIQSVEEEKRLASLVKVYEGMKPQSAATILNTLDTEVLMSVMGRMSDRKMSPILAAMDPNRAREVTINLALQKKLPAAAAQKAAAPATLPEPDAPPAQ